MNLTRWSPFQDMTPLESHLKPLSGGALKGWPGESDRASTWTPPADICETENELVVIADLPGVDPRKLVIQVENSVLTIRGERRSDERSRGENFRRVERPHGPFARSFALATPVEANKVVSRYKDGVLRISMPKSQPARPMQLQFAAAA